MGTTSKSCLSSLDYILVAYIVVTAPTSRLIKAKFSISPLPSSRDIPQNHNGHAPQANSLPAQLLMIIPHRIKTRNFPRLRKRTERMELAMELQEEQEYSIVM